jgi:hypothetical protein
MILPQMLVGMIVSDFASGSHWSHFLRANDMQARSFAQLTLELVWFL